MSKESQGPSLGVHLIEVSVKRELTVFPWLHDIRSMSYSHSFWQHSLLEKVKGI